MHLLIKFVCLGAVSALAGCDTGPQEPIVTDFNGASVKVLIPAMPSNNEVSSVERAKAHAEAARICQSGRTGTNAEYVSTRTLTERDPFWGTTIYQKELLFLCLK